jgi:phosphatidate phosphatase APP1
MRAVKRIAHRLLHGLEERIDRRAAGRPVARRVVIHPYRGFGRAGELLLRGRVLVGKHITRVQEAEALWRNLLNTYRRFQSDEVAGARIVATFRDAVVETVSDAEGYFQAVLRPTELDLSRPWHEVGLALPEHGVTAVAHVLVPPDDARFGIISDIDDTIVQTNATSIPRMVRSVIRNAASRLPFDGVAELYQALHADRNPIFYVSSSPWNMYDLLHDYMDLNGIPHGPMFLQDWGLDEATLITQPHETHKLAQIQTLLDYYPDMRFVLIGDSGQHDPEIYLRVIQSRPERIAAAFIRDVTHDLRDQAVVRILEQANAAGVEMLYVRDSAEALQHATRLGLTTMTA